MTAYQGFLKSKIISSENDKIGLVFYNIVDYCTLEATKNSSVILLIGIDISAEIFPVKLKEFFVKLLY